MGANSLCMSQIVANFNPLYVGHFPLPVSYKLQVFCKKTKSSVIVLMPVNVLYLNN